MGRISDSDRARNEEAIRAAMDRMLRGELPPGGKCDLKTLAMESGITRTGFYPKKNRDGTTRPGPYQHLAEEFERRLTALQQAGEIVDPRANGSRPRSTSSKIGSPSGTKPSPNSPRSRPPPSLNSLPSMTRSRDSGNRQPPSATSAVCLPPVVARRRTGRAAEAVKSIRIRIRGGHPVGDRRSPPSLRIA